MSAIFGLASRRAGSVALLLASVFGLAASALGENGRSDPLCPHIVACQYEAPAFSIRVVDQQTGQPLADVHAIAAWLVYGFHGRRGVLMALESVSGPDGQLSFPAWGPVKSGVEGLVLGRDPLVSLFRPGYRKADSQRSSNRAVRYGARTCIRSSWATFELVPLQGSLQ